MIRRIGLTSVMGTVFLLGLLQNVQLIAGLPLSAADGQSSRGRQSKWVALPEVPSIGRPFYAALKPAGVLADSQPSIVYYPDTGEILLDAPANTDLSSVWIQSASGVFTGAAPDNLGGDFDADDDHGIFKAVFDDTFGSISFGNVAIPGLPRSYVQNDLDVIGTRAGSGLLPEVDLVYMPGTALTTSLELGGIVSDAQTSILYDATTGRLALDVPAEQNLKSINIDSASGVFTGAARNMVDSLTSSNAFKGRPDESFGSLTFGKVATPHLSESFLQSDLSIFGLRQSGDVVDAVDLVYFPAGPVRQGLRPGGRQGDVQTSIVYEAMTGSLSVDAPQGVDLSSIDISSSSGIFKRSLTQNLDGPFDSYAEDNIFKAAFDGGFGSINFGAAVEPGLPETVLIEDLTVIGRLIGGDGLGNVDLVYLQTLPPGRLGDGKTSVVYDAGTGRVMVDAPAGTGLSSVRIVSRSSVFTGASADNLGGDFDLDEDDRVFKATFGNPFHSLGLGKIAQPGLPEELVRNDLSITGTLARGGIIGDTDLVYISGGPGTDGLSPGGQLDDGQTSIIYDANTGRLSVDAPAESDLRSIDIVSKEGRFGGTLDRNLRGPFDIQTRQTVFRADFDQGFGSFSLGRIAETGLAESLLQNDLIVNGGLANGMGLGDVDLIYLAGFPFVPGLQQGGQTGDARPSVIYLAETGRVLFEVPDDVDLRSLEIRSNSPILSTHEEVQDLDGPFDTHSEVHLYKAQFQKGFGSTNFGKISQTGLTESELRRSLTTIGRLADGGSLGEVDLVYLPGEELTQKLRPGGSRNDDQTSIVYDSITGALSVDAPTGLQLHIVDIDSASGTFTGSAPQNLNGTFDHYNNENLFKADFDGGFGSVSFGSVTPSDLSQTFLLDDLSMSGNLVAGGGLGNVDLIYLRGLLKGRIGDRQTSIIYDASTGRIMVDTHRDVELTSIWIRSMESIFTGAPADNLGGVFDSDDDGSIFKAIFGGSFGSLGFGKVAQPGLTESFIRNDLSIDGTSAARRRQLGDVDLVYVPGQPATPGLGANGRIGDKQTSLVYYAHTGRVIVDGPSADFLTSIDIASEGSIFTAEPAKNLGGPFDVDQDNNIFKATYDGGIPAVNLGQVAATDLTESFLQSDLTVAGSLKSANNLGSVDLVYVPPATLEPNGQRGDGKASIIYHADNGLLWIEPPLGDELTSVELFSASGIFTGRSRANLGGPLDVRTDNNILKATFDNSFGEIEFGSVAQARLSESFLLEDITIAGTLLGGGTLSLVDLAYFPGVVIQMGLLSGGKIGDDRTSIVYDASTGRIMVDASVGVNLTTIDIESELGIFTGSPAHNLASDFDIDNDNVVFKSIFPPGSFGSLSFGKVAKTELDETLIQDDLSVVGSRLGGGALGEVDLIYIPGQAASPGIRPGGQKGDDQTSLVYDANTGELSLDAAAGTNLMLLDIASNSGILRGLPAQNLEGPFDTDTNGDLFKASFDGGFGSVTFGNAAMQRLPSSLLRRDLTVTGTLTAGDNLGNVDLVYTPDSTLSPGLQSGGQVADGQTSVVYFAGSGRILVDPPAESRLGWIDLNSASSIFTGRSARDLGGAADHDADDNIFKARFDEGFGVTNLGKVARAGISLPSIQTDLTVSGTLMDGSGIGQVDLVYVPGEAVVTGVTAGGRLRDGQTSIVYYSHTGRVLIDAPTDTNLTSIDIQSASAVFTGQPAKNFNGPFDEDTDGNIFKFEFDQGFGSLVLGTVAQAGLTESLLTDDLTITGSLSDASQFGRADLIHVPGNKLQIGGRRRDGQTSLIYDANKGTLSVDAPIDIDLASIDITSSKGIFTQEQPDNLGDAFDAATPSNLFKVTLDNSFGSFSFGQIVQPGLTETFLRGDLTVGGTLVDGRHLGNVDLIYLRSLPVGALGDQQTSIIYDAGTGRVMIDAADVEELTSIRIASADALLTGQPAQNLGGDFDIDEDGRIFKARFGESFASFNLGKVAQPGLAESVVQADFSVLGTHMSGRGLGAVDLIYVPGTPVTRGIQPGGQVSDSQTSIVYDATTGRVMVDAPSDVDLTSIDIDSAASIFMGGPAEQLGGPFDTDRDNNIFKAQYAGRFGSFGLGRVAQPRLPESTLQGDLMVSGSLADGGNLGSVDLIYIPATEVTPGVQIGGQPADGKASVIYFANTGRLLLEAPPGAQLRSLDIDSNTSVLSGPSALNLDGPFDSHGTRNIYKAVFDGGFGSLNLGRVVQLNLSETALQNDLTVIGSLTDDSGLGNVDLVYIQGAAIQPGIQLRGSRNDQQTSIVYDVSTGRLSLDAPAELTLLEIESAAGIFTGNGPVENLNGVFDALLDDNLFKVSFEGSFGSLSFGEIARRNLADSFLSDDLTVTGTLADGNDLGPVDLVYLKSLLQGHVEDSQTSIIYDANTGRVMVDAARDNELTAVRIESRDSIFTGQPPENLGGDFDIEADDKIFKATFGDRFRSLSLGKVAQPGISESQIRNDLVIDGTLAGGGRVRNVDLIYIPGGPVTSGLRQGGQLGDSQTSIVYYSRTGRILVDAPPDSKFTSIDIASSASVLTERPAQNLRQFVQTGIPEFGGISYSLQPVRNL